MWMLIYVLLHAVFAQHINLTFILLCDIFHFVILSIIFFFTTALHSSVSYLACCRYTWSFGVSSWLSCVKCFDNVIYICLCCPWNSCVNWHSRELCCTTRLEIHFKKCYYLFLIISSNWDTWWYVLEN